MTIKVDTKHLLPFLRSANEKIMDLLVTFNVPDSIEDNDVDAYLLNNSKTASKSLGSKKNTASIDELQDRLNTIKNKMKTKKGPQSEKQRKRKEAKKLKKNKEFKKVLISAAKSMKNEQAKQAAGDDNNSDDDEKEDKKNIKPVIAKPVFNEEGKIVFSKFDFAQKKKKSHQNPREILKKIKATDRKINELKEAGETEKALEIKNDLAWQKAFDKVDGKKVKDDPKLLYKAIKKRKVEKKKSKKEWTDRKNKVEHDISSRQKKRNENINKRIKDKQNRKAKRASKKGRVIPGF